MKKMIALPVLLMLVLGAGVSSFAQDAEPINVGAIFDLTGPTSDAGTPYGAGMRAYVDWLNENGGIEGHPINLIWEDYAYDTANAENLYTQFVDEGLVAFQGWGTGDTETLRARVAEDELPFMSASYSAALNDPAGTAPYNFLVGTSYSDQMVIMLQYLLDQWVADGNDPADMHVALFYHDSPFGNSPLADGEAFAQENGFTTIRVAMPRGATDFTAELESADAELDPMTHLVVQNVSSPPAVLFKNARDLGYEDVTMACLNWCADELMIRLAGDAAEGVLGALPFVPGTAEDVEGLEAPAEWLEKTGEYPSLEGASLHYHQAWWTMAVMAEGMRIVLQNGDELTGPNLKAALETLTDFETQGVTAPITFTPDDHRGTRALKIYRVEGGKWVPISDLLDLRAEEE
jgi:branched-chain amino acid transport system substrate-binding protein